MKPKASVAASFKATGGPGQPDAGGADRAEADRDQKRRAIAAGEVVDRAAEPGLSAPLGTQLTAHAPIAASTPVIR